MPLSKHGRWRRKLLKDYKSFSGVEALFSLLKKGLDVLQPIGQSKVKLEESIM